MNARAFCTEDLTYSFLLSLVEERRLKIVVLVNCAILRFIISLLNMVLGALCTGVFGFAAHYKNIRTLLLHRFLEATADDGKPAATSLNTYANIVIR